MPAAALSTQISFLYRTTDSATGVTRKTAQQLAERLGVDETQAIHLALCQLAVKVLPQYDSDDGPLTAAQVRRIKRLVPAAKKRSIRSSLFDVNPER